jgi:pimeloyl-ACP methyl ester carboxylesterase
LSGLDRNDAVIGLLLLLLLGLIVYVFTLILITLRTLTRPPRRTYASAIARNRPGDPGELPPGPAGPRHWESWTFRSRNLDLPVWDMTGDDHAGPVLVLSHGWGDSRIGALTRAEHLLPLCSRLIAWDMPGHGDAPGSCSLGLREPDDLLALLEHLRSDTPVILFGWSLGAGVSIAAAAKASASHSFTASTPSPSAPAAVIAEAPYRFAATPARNVLIRAGLPWRANLPAALRIVAFFHAPTRNWQDFDRAELAARLRMPLLVIHGQLDDISPLEDGLEIARRAAARCVTIPGAGHYALWSNPDHARTCRAAVEDLLATIHHVPQSHR